jgi:hypothetical protein
MQTCHIGRNKKYHKHTQWSYCIVKKAIKNAFDNVPFGDLTYGLLGSVPVEMLHVGGAGILKYIFEY